MKNKKGITLIALVITIIVLLILAGVSITALVGDNGIISQAMKSKTKTEEAAIKEQIELAWAARMSKFLEEKDRDLLDSTYWEEIKNDLNQSLYGQGLIRALKYDEQFIMIYQTSDGNNYEIGISKSGQILYNNNITEPEALAKIEEFEKASTPTEFAYGNINNTNNTVAITNLKNKSSVVNVVIPSKVKINSSGDYDNVNGKEYYVTSIGNGAFSGANYLKNVIIRSGVKTIENNAFDECRALKNITLPNSLTSIGTETFYGCNQLESIEIPNNVQRLEDALFGNCTKLKNIKLPDSLVRIGNAAFFVCTSLESIDIPDSVVFIGSQAFQNCTSLKEVKIPNKLTTIQSSSFSNCRNLYKVTIPKSVTRIDMSAFYNCTNLTTVNYTGTEAQWNAISIGSYNTPLINATKVYNYSGN